MQDEKWRAATKTIESKAIEHKESFEIGYFK